MYLENRLIRAERGVRGGGNTIRELQPAGRPGAAGGRRARRRGGGGGQGGGRGARAGDAGARAPPATALTSRTVPDR
ncbi:unnamed protein product, partial [Iphiclides podalirius]